MQVDVVQIGTNIIVGAVIACVAGFFGGFFGVRHGLERAKRERAFDRQLEWHEKAVRTINRFLTSAWEFRNAIVFGNPEDIPVLLKSLEATADELDVSMEESVLFAERKIVIDLQNHIGFLQDLIVQIKDRDERSDPSGIADITRDLARSFRKLSFSLSQSVRKQLDLDDISPDDLKTELDKAREAEQKSA